VAFAAALASFTAADQGLAAQCKLLKIADLPVSMIDFQPRVAAKINGADVLFLADSGAFYSAIPPPNAAALHLSTYSAPFQLYITGVGGDADAMVTRVDKLTLAGSDIRHVEFIVAGSGVGMGATGLLGENILGLADADYDLAHGLIRLVKPDGCDNLALAYWTHDGAYAETTLLRPRDEDPRFSRLTPSPRAEAFVNGKSIRVMLDTGASTSVMSLEAARRAGVTPQSPGTTLGGATFGVGRHADRSWIATFSSFKIGPEEIKNAKIRMADISLGDVDMLLGADFFLAHHVFVSNSQRKIYFTYNGGPVFNIRGAAAGGAVASAAGGGKLDLGDADTLARLGEAALSRGETQRALSDLLRAHLLEPLEARYDYQLGRAHLAANEPVLAGADFDEAVTLKPDYADPRLARAQMRLARHNAAALEDLDALSLSLPKQADMRLVLADAFDKADKFEKAVAEFDLWIKNHSEDARLASAYVGRCWAKSQIGADLQGALSDCARASHLGASGTDEFLAVRGLAKLRLHDDPGALKDYDAALALNPKNAWALYGRSVVKTRLGLPNADADREAATAILPRIALIWKRRGLTS